MKAIMTIMAVSLLIACKEESKEPTSMLVAEIPGYVVVPNTESPDYARYKELWKKANTIPENGYKPKEEKKEQSVKKTPPTKKPVEIQLDELDFNHAFSIQYRAKGEGRTFWWRGDEYTTNLKENE